MNVQFTIGVGDDILLWKQLRYQVPLSAESCDLNCVRRRSEKRLRKTIRTLRKSINREQFHLHFAGSDYELGKSLGQPVELPGHCVAGQVLVGRKCGEFGFCIYLSVNPKSMLKVRMCTSQPGITSTGNIDAFHLSRAQIKPLLLHLTQGSNGSD